MVAAEEDREFGLPEVKRGLIARAGGIFRVPRLLPRPIALELLMTGDPIDAARAERYGLINRVVPDGTALEAAKELASAIACNAPLSVRNSKAVAGLSVSGPTSRPSNSKSRIPTRFSRPRTLLRSRSRSPNAVRRSGRAADVLFRGGGVRCRKVAGPQWGWISVLKGEDAGL